MISATLGKVYNHYGIRSFTAQDMVTVLRQVRAATGPGARLAMFWDNCRIHYSTIVREAAEEEDIELIFNCPYRPDLAAIELFWAEAKRRYRRELDRLKACDLPFDPTGLVQHILDGIEDELVIRLARHGEEAIAQAEPIEPLLAEQ